MSTPAPATLVLVLHSHQPVGNFDFVFAEAYANAYAPFLEVLEAHPAIRLGLHYSGILLDWLAANEPAFLARLAALVRSGRVELLTGGYYEPILPVIPDADKIGQIQKLTARLRADFGVKARGAWLAERVWEPSLPQPLRAAGVEYTMLDDTHFVGAGVVPDATFGYYITEEQGHALAVFPMNMRLRQLMPFAPVADVMAFCKKTAKKQPGAVLFMGDDGEKFGNWPGTHNSVYTEGWLDAFFTAVEQSGWLTTATPSDIIDREPPLGTIYIPTGSYAEMIEWSGGFWRNFFVKYPEANAIHKKMLEVSARVAALPQGKAADAIRDELWQGQCNCAFWHGVFGGLYLNHMRAALWEHLIRASALLDKREHGAERWLSAEQRDIDFDGRDEAIVRSAAADVILDRRGGALIEWDDKRTFVNACDTLARRREAYHAKLEEQTTDDRRFDGHASIHDLTTVKERDLERWLRYDAHRRGMLVDRFYAPSTSAWDIALEAAQDVGGCASADYEISVKRRTDGATIALSRAAHIDVGQGPQEIALLKTLRFAEADASRFVANYKVTNHSGQPFRARFGIECNLGLQAADAPDRYFHARARRLEPASAGAHGVDRDREISALDAWRGFEFSIKCGVETEFARYGVYTVSLSEAGIERTYQGTAIVPSWRIDVAPAQSWEMSIELRLVALPREPQASGQTVRTDARTPA